MAKKNLPNGVYTATLTPLKNNGKPDYSLLAQHCKWLLKKGSTGIALLGTTGEATSFSISERKKILSATIDRGIPAKKIMAGTGCCALSETVALTKHAVQLGVGGILLLPPYYYKQVSQEGIYQYVASLIEQVADANLRIYLYHFPKMSGLAFSIPIIKKLRANFPKVVVGIKDSSGDFSNMKAMVKKIPNFQVFAGTEKYLLDILKIGGAGCISATANITVPLCGEVYQLWKGKKSAKKKNDYLIKVRTSFEGLPFSGALKTYKAHISGNINWSTVRLPNEPLSSKEFKGLLDRLEKLDFHPS